MNVESIVAQHFASRAATATGRPIRAPRDRKFVEAVARGMLTPAEAHEVRWAGERAIEHVLLHEPPFDVDWSSWRPDPAWGPLELPDLPG